MPGRRCQRGGAGAGLIRADLRAVRGTGICQQPGGVTVQVHGRRPRAVPVLAHYHAPLLAAAAFAGEHLLTGGTGPARHNISNPLTASLTGGSGLPPLEGSRLRATSLAGSAQLTGLPVFLHAAGITCCQRLGDIAATWIPAGNPARSPCPAARAGDTAVGGRAGLAAIEAIIDASGAARAIEALRPAGVRHRQLTARTLLTGDDAGHR